jgi:O-antigen/teichoic acid export membrane protein
VNHIKFSLSNILTKALLLPLNFLSLILVSNILGPDDRGKYSFAILLIALGVSIFSFGTNYGTMILVSTRKYQVEQIAISSIISSLLMGCLACLIVMGLWHFHWLGNTGNHFDLFIIAFIGLALILHMIQIAISNLLLGDSQFIFLNWVQIVQGVLNPILLISAVYIFSQGIRGGVISVVLVNLISFLILFIFLLKSYNISWSYNKDFLKDKYRIGKKIWIGDMANLANGKMDQLLLGSLGKSSDLGIYSLAVSLAEMIWIIPDAVNPIFINKIAVLSDEGQKKRITFRLAKILVYSGILLYLLMLVGVIGFLIPNFLDVKFGNLWIPVLVLAPGMITYIYAKVFSKFFSAQERVDLAAKISIYGACICVLLYLFLIPPYGVVGAALASCLGYISIGIIAIGLYRRYYSNDLSGLWALDISDWKWIRSNLLFNK